MTGDFNTRWATVVFEGDGNLRIFSDGILDCGEWKRADLEKALKRLEAEGWLLVGSVDRQVDGRKHDALDMFFRRKKGEERMAAVSIPTRPIEESQS